MPRHRVPGYLSRLRFVRDRKMNLANLVDKCCARYGPDARPIYVDRPLQFERLRSPDGSVLERPPETFYHRAGWRWFLSVIIVAGVAAPAAGWLLSMGLAVALVATVVAVVSAAVLVMVWNRLQNSAKLAELPPPGTAATLSYGQILDFINRLGNTLRDEAGMKPYDRVAVCKSNEPDYFILALAIIKAGGIAVPINGGMSLEGLKNYLEHTGSQILITDAATFSRTVESADRLPVVRTWLFPKVPEGFSGTAIDLNKALEEVSNELEPVETAGDRDAMIVHTSGTTGFPKGVLHSNDTLLISLRKLLSFFPARVTERQLYAWPFNHIIAHSGGIATLLTNVPAWFVSDFDAHEVLKLIDRAGITQYLGFPDTYLRLYDAGLDDYKLDTMRVWACTADASHEVHIRAFTAKGAFLRLFGRRILSSMFFDGLGSSEVNSGALFNFSFSFSRRFNRFVGRPLPIGPKIKVADEHGRPVPANTIGRFMVKSPTLFKGYWNAHDRLHGVFFDGWWWTGDIGYRDRWGRYYHLDRAVDVIDTETGPVYSLVVEEILLKHSAIGEAVVVGAVRDDGFQSPVALVHSKWGRDIDEQECLEWANERLNGAERLAAIRSVSVDDIERGLTGKVLKRRLRERFADSWQLSSLSTSDEEVRNNAE